MVAIQPTLEAIDELYFPEYLTYLWRLLGPARNQAMLFAALPGLVIVLFRRRTRAFGVWAIGLALLSMPIGFYVAPFRPDHAAIVLFLPTALLIAELLPRKALVALLDAARDLGLACLVEAHSVRAVKKAVGAGARVVGINNRDLRTFKTDLRTTRRLIEHVPADRLVVSESAIRTRADVEQAGAWGAAAVLVGEALMRERYIGRAVDRLMGPASR